MKAGFTWIVQVARCCGKKYRRARLPDRGFPITGQVCIHCERPLVWSVADLKAAKNANQQSKRAALVAQGLTTDGTPRVNKLRPELAGLHGRERINKRMRLVTREQALQGLTARGKPRKLVRPHLTEQAILLERIREEIAAKPGELPIATGFRDMGVNERAAESGRRNRWALKQMEATMEATANARRAA